MGLDGSQSQSLFVYPLSAQSRIEQILGRITVERRRARNRVSSQRSAADPTEGPGLVSESLLKDNKTQVCDQEIFGYTLFQYGHDGPCFPDVFFFLAAFSMKHIAVREFQRRSTESALAVVICERRETQAGPLD